MMMRRRRKKKKQQQQEQEQSGDLSLLFWQVANHLNLHQRCS